MYAKLNDIKNLRTLIWSVKVWPIVRAWLGFPRIISKHSSRPNCLLTLDSRRWAQDASAREGIRSKTMWPWWAGHCCAAVSRDCTISMVSTEVCLWRLWELLILPDAAIRATQYCWTNTVVLITALCSFGNLKQQKETLKLDYDLVLKFF